LIKLYWGPHTCAIGIHILLEEIGKPYETEKLDVSGGATHAPPFLSVNPKGKVPTLVRDDGSVLTEFGAIATWLARTNPEKNFLPSDPEIEARAAETIAYVEGSIHGQGFARLFKPQTFEPQDMVHGKLGIGQSAVKLQGRQIIETGFAILDPSLGRYPYAAGEVLTIADFALFYVERWSAPQAIALPINIAAHFTRMLARPAVHKVRTLWGEG
jgi:glutathione S-transferase